MSPRLIEFGRFDEIDIDCIGSCNNDQSLFELSSILPVECGGVGGELHFLLGVNGFDAIAKFELDRHFRTSGQIDVRDARLEVVAFVFITAIFQNGLKSGVRIHRHFSQVFRLSRDFPHSEILNQISVGWECKF